MLTSLSSTLFTFLMAMASMAFFTLLERKILGYSQSRKGPNKPSIQGLPQPMADALKLFTKSSMHPHLANLYPFLMSPMINLMLALMLWMLMPSISPTLFMPYGMIFFLCVSSLSVYTMISMGWSSNSKYALIGTLRSIAQTISYEVTLALWLISIIVLLSTYNLQHIHNSANYMLTMLSPPTAFIWLICLLAETNRTPFDFTEGESELVSGFNTEYASTPFAFIFMSEYLNIMMVSVITSVILLQKYLNPYLSSLSMICQSTMIMSLFVLIRTTMPRMRYDRLMTLTWMSFLPLSLAFIMNMSAMYFLSKY